MKTAKNAVGRTEVEFRSFALNAGFVLLLSLLILFNADAFHFTSVTKLWHHLSTGQLHKFFWYSAIWSLSIYAVYCIAVMRSGYIRGFWLLLIFCSSLLADLSLATTGMFINDQLIEMFWNARFSTDAFFVTHWHEVFMAGGKSLLLPLCIFFAPIRTRSASRIVAAFPLVAIASLFLFFRTTVDGGAYGVPSQFSSTAVFLGWVTAQKEVHKKGEVNIPIVRDAQVKHILFIVDESIRADYLDINGAQQVTPYLRRIKHRVLNFGLGTSGNNCTAMSNALLRFGFNPRAAGQQGSDEILSHPTIWKYARTAGFTTAFIDNQRTVGQLQNYMDDAEVALIDRVHQFQPSTARMARDHASVEIIRSVQRSNEKTFIYVNKAGAHVPYEDAYPDGKEHFSPHLQYLEAATDRERTINSYKNAVRWSVDDFFRKLLPAVDLKNTLIIYTSDHGQNLLDDDSALTHCRIKNPRQEEALVPLFALTGNPYLRRKFHRAASLNLNRAHHLQIFSTVLSVMGFESKMARERYYESLFEPMVRPLGFTSAEGMKKFGRSQKWQPLRWHGVGFSGRGREEWFRGDR